MAWLLLLFPIAGAIINLFAGHRFDRRIIGGIASVAVAASFLITLVLLVDLLRLPAHERSVESVLWTWITIGSFSVPAGLLIDPLSVTMCLIVTGVGTLIHIYAVGYMDHEERFQRFFVYLNFFIFAMLILVLSNNFLGMFVGWEGVGLASYLLIGFYFDKEDDTYGSYADCGKKAFIVNRIGDFGMILAIMAVWTAVGTLTFVDVNHDFHEPGMVSVGVANLICFLLLLGATGKSAQIPLYVWLPDAMAGPTPVSALIHAATMVTAGIYMIARTHEIWYLAGYGLGSAPMVAAWIGGLTALLAATIALTQTDLKKILAYSTVSQLGFMMMGVGVGAYGAAIFHLMTHAFFKALLFLAAGSVMHALHGELDIRKMGGLREKMPVTSWTFTVGAIALAGIPPLAGFWSKDEIKASVLDADLLLYIIALVAALLTAFYSFRAAYLAFYGNPRDAHVFESAHENPATMTIPLRILAVLALIGGFINLPFFPVLNNWLEPSIGHHHLDVVTMLIAAILSILIAAFGTMLAFAHYHRGEERAANLLKPFQALAPLAEQKWYVDEIYQMLIVSPLLALSNWFANIMDQKGIDGAVNLLGSSTMIVGNYARRIQTGLIPNYALSILLGAVIILAYFMLA
ncbi:MAG: NADH-quinone oxidoreductase subunit L [Chloroflexota bacterium]